MRLKYDLFPILYIVMTCINTLTVRFLLPISFIPTTSSFSQRSDLTVNFGQAA
jgi:hypothetical protein